MSGGWPRHPGDHQPLLWDVPRATEQSRTIRLPVHMGEAVGRVGRTAERLIIELRYGLTDGQRRTLAEVGRVLGMTRERARQIEAIALRRLRDLDVGRQLRDYLE